MADVLERKIRQFKTLMELSSLVNSTLDTREIRKRAIEAAASLVNAESGSLLLVDQETGELFFEVALGEKGEMLKKTRLAKRQGIAGCVAATGEPVIVHDVKSDSRFFKGADSKSSFRTKNMICVPVTTKNKIVGVLEAINKREGMFDEEDKEGLTALANQVAVAIENANLYNDLREGFYGTAEALAELIEQRDPYTGGHTRRVMNYSIAIGKEMGLSEEDMENLKLAAILHDIGKIGVRDSILLKKGALDKDETMKMSRHSEYASKSLGHIKKLRKVVPGVRGHHEKYDGSGYPDKLKGTEIPCIARIIAVADAFDAITTDRPYRKALSMQTAIGELKKNIGVQFDSEVVENFIKVCKKGGADEIQGPR
jgi:HD-GYP domain-containing protein (c-di-GMP phosphodiesterase class II)